jgi:hypothetical protein
MDASGEPPDKIMGRLLPKEYLEDTAVEAIPHFIDRLNQAKLKLPADYFLQICFEPTNLAKRDSALSTLGLQRTMQYFCQQTGLPGRVFSWAELKECNFNINEAILGEIAASSAPAQIFILCADASERHVTGLYIMKNHAEPNQAYFFDTTGISLPAHPCGLRGYAGQENTQLVKLMQYLSTKMTIHIMPINTAKSLQSDSFSCLMATLFFFMAMNTGEYTSVDQMGIIGHWGDPFVRQQESMNVTFSHPGFPVALYSLTSELFLAGIQSRITFILALDSIGEIGDRLLHTGSLASTRANWTELCHDESLYGRPMAINTLWPTAYIELLKWLDQKQTDESAALPDFDKMMRKKRRQAPGITPFEILTGEIYSKATIPDHGAGCGTLGTSVYTGHHPARDGVAASTPSAAPPHPKKEADTLPPINTTPFQRVSAKQIQEDLLKRQQIFELRCAGARI